MESPQSSLNSLPSFTHFNSPSLHSPPIFTSQLDPHLYLNLLQSKIDSRFGNSIFIQDVVTDLIFEINDVVTQIDRINRNAYDDLIKLGFQQHAMWLEQVRKTQAWFVVFMCEKLKYMTGKYQNAREKETMRPNEKTYCSICSKQLREAKIQQISNSLHTGNHLATYKDMREDSDQQVRYNELDIIMNQIETSKKQLLSINNQKTIFSLQQFLHQTNHTIQVFYQDRTNFQRMQDNRDVVAVLFKQFITKFMEISNSDIKPTVIKCAEDLAEFLFKRRKQGMKFEEKEVQTMGTMQKVRTVKNLDVKSRSNTKDANQAIKKNQEMLIEHKIKIEMLVRQNGNLEKQIKHLNTQKILSSMRMLEDDVVIESEIQQDQYQNRGQHNDSDKRVFHDTTLTKQEFESIKVDPSGAKRVTILRTSSGMNSIKPVFRGMEMKGTRASGLISGKQSYYSKSNRSGISGSYSGQGDEMVQFGNQEDQEEREDNQEICKSRGEIESEGNEQKRERNKEVKEYGIQVSLQTQELAIQTDPYPTLISPSFIPQPTPFYRKSAPLHPFSQKHSFQQTSTSTTSNWQISSAIHPTQIVQSHQPSQSQSESQTQMKSYSNQILSPKRIKSESIKNQLISMITKMNANMLKQMSQVYLKRKSVNERRNKTGVTIDRVTVANRISLDENAAQLVGRSLKPLANMEIIRQNNSKQGISEQIKVLEEPDKIKSVGRKSDFLSMTQNRFNKEKGNNRSSQQGFGTMIEGKSSILNLSNSLVNTRPKGQTQIVQRMKTQTIRRNNQISFDQVDKTHTELLKKEPKPFHDHFSQNDLILFFGSIQSAFDHQSSPNLKYKLQTKFKKKHQILIFNIYTHLQQLKKTNNDLYQKIKGFVKFPYQSVLNQFDGLTIQSSLSQSAFGNLMTHLLNLHDGCERGQKKVYCEHIAGLLRKFQYGKLGEKEKEKEKINLPKLQESVE